MPIIKALQHLFSSVERGYDPRRKGGFQTVGVTEELTGTEDLRALEDAAFYALSRERRAARDFPVKQTIFRLPSGRFALGRTVDWGTDSLGREGNYLTYQLVFSRDDLLTAGADPFAILEAARLGEKMAEGSFDMSPRALPPLAVEIAPSGIDFHGFEGIKPELLANLTAAAVDGGEKTVLLIGDETLAEGVLRGVYASMATEERLRLTFATHFYESHHLRSFFTLATVRSREEVPSRRENYLVFDLGDGEFPRISPASAYAGWLADCLHSRRWEEIGVLNAFLDGVRNGRGEAGKGALPIGTKACAALWERAGEKVVQALLGDVGLTVEFLRKLSSSRPLADALLAAASPAKLCGPNATSDAAQACLAALRSAASGKAWREWVKKWSDDLALGSFATDTQTWWQRWKRRNE